MTTKPRFKLGSHLVPGLAAVALFGVMAAVFLQTSFGDAAGFPEGANITASIGYAMFNLDFGAVSGEGFLVAFLIMAVALDVALDGAVHLAKRDDETSFVDAAASSARDAVTGDRAARTDGGRNRDDTEGEQ
ncbi:NADH-quinone oxidoreductase subunit J [Halogranum rubrum]|uniref:NADH-quinone oxidoreductase subunit J n=1 Tax=Halogranum rubrum TaxID=553466 RepID=A0A1I4EX97_9EURY|nr:proton-conducting membrane transporter [Halogranum rubrum]SFL09823.1 NADH-quinone oxidoreductase subunit J [Halogranum rubrum]